MPNNVWAEEIAGSEGTDYNEAYAVLVMSSGEDTGKSDAYLTLYYDNKKSEHNEGAVVDLDRLATSQEMLMNRQYLHSVLFDPSFADCRPTSTAYWFAGCFSLEAIDNLQYLNTSEVTDMTEMFNECPLEELDLSTFNTSKVTSFNRMFGMCRSLKVLNLSSWNTENCTDFEMMFNGCASLTTIYVGSYWSTASATDTSMFGGCTSLVGGNGTTFSQEHIGIDYAHIDRADQPGYLTYGESSGSGAEAYAVISQDGTGIAFYYDTYKSNREGVVFGIDEIKDSWEYMKYIQGVETAVFDPSFADARPTNGYNWFGNAFSLKSITGLEYLNTSKMTTMECMFMDCPNITELDLSHFETSLVTSMNNMFYGFPGTTLDLSTFDTSNVTDMGFMFGRSENLTTIYVSDKWSVANVTSADAMFEECTKLVGGNGTKYDENHTDQSYARIDTERAPGYFTDIADKGKEKMEQVATPTWAFLNEMLALSTETTDASIYYATANWENEAETDSIANTIDVSTRSTLYQNPIEITDNIIIKMIAAKEGMENSEVATFVYDYKSWKELYETVTAGVELLSKAQDSGKVDEGLLEELKWALNEGDMMYQRRAEMSNQEAKYFTDAIVNICIKIKEQMEGTTEQVKTPEFKIANDLLEISTETLDAKIYYAIKKFDNDLLPDSINKLADELAVSVDSIEYKDPIEANYDFIIKAMAVKEGMENSKDTTYIYPYTEWMNLLVTIDIGKTLTSTILNENPSENIIAMLDVLRDHMEIDYSTYLNERTKWDRETVIYERYRLEDEIKHIDLIWQEEKSKQTTAIYENHILTVEGDVSMAQALEQVGGRNVVAKDIAAIVWNSSEAITRSDIEGFGNPNLLIYVQTDSLAPEGVNNVVINGKAKSITLVDAESNNNFYAPMAFTAESISYTREFKQTTEKDVSRGWEGIALPFTVQKFTHESHGEIAPFGNDASIFHFWLHQMTDKGMVNATTIEANKPYIISMPNNGSYPEAYNQAGKVTFSAENVTVPVSDNTAIWTADGTIGMMSTYLRIEPSEYIYALNVGSTMESYAEGSVFVQNLREVKPFEVFTFHEENHHEGAGARFISVSSLFGGEGTTGIIDVMKDAEPDGETWYDLNGRRLQSKPVRKGVYIKNGKKVVVK